MQLTKVLNYKDHKNDNIQLAVDGIKSWQNIIKSLQTKQNR
jgi:hypothetical protein